MPSFPELTERETFTLTMMRLGQWATVWVSEGPGLFFFLATIKIGRLVLTVFLRIASSYLASKCEFTSHNLEFSIETLSSHRTILKQNKTIKKVTCDTISQFRLLSKKSHDSKFISRNCKKKAI